MRHLIGISRFNPLGSSAERGQGTLELALCLPLFLLLIAGGAEIANLAWASVQVNNAARAGAAYGSISRANAASTTNIQTAAQNEAPRLLTTPSTQVTSTQLCYCVTSGTPGSADAGCTNTNLSTCPAPGVIQMAIKVNTSVTVSTLIHYIGLPSTYTVRGQAIVGVQQ